MKKLILITITLLFFSSSVFAVERDGFNMSFMSYDDPEVCQQILGNVDLSGLAIYVNMRSVKTPSQGVPRITSLNPSVLRYIEKPKMSQSGISGYYAYHSSSSVPIVLKGKNKSMKFMSVQGEIKEQLNDWRNFSGALQVQSSNAEGPVCVILVTSH